MRDATRAEEALLAREGAVDELIDQQEIAGRPVLDATCLTGRYSFQLYFTPDAARTNSAPTDPTSTAADEPSLFAALQEQLGLRLEPRIASMEFLVIDRAEKVPTEN